MGKARFSMFLIYVLAIFNAQPASAITNGKLAPEGLAVKVFSDAGGCTGAVWKSTIVITAAHCVVHESGELGFNIQVEAYIENQWQTSDVVGVKIPKEFTPTKNGLYTSRGGDIAFLILKNQLWDQPIFPTLRIATINDWRKYELNPPWLEAIGYGFTSNSGQEVPTTYPISGMFLLDFSFNPSSFDEATFYSTKSSLCHGDSGAPVIYYREEEKDVVLVGIFTSLFTTDTTSNCASQNSGLSSANFVKLSSYSALAESTLRTEARYRPSALVIGSATELLEGYRNSISDLNDLGDQLSVAAKKKLITNNRNIEVFVKLVDEYETKIESYEESLNQSMDFASINWAVLEANTPDIKRTIQTNLKKYEARINLLASKIQKTLPLFVCSNDIQIKDFPSNKKCPKGYAKVELPQPFGDS
jgi:hypothetical protein